MAADPGDRASEKWQGLYRAAVVELDPNRLLERITEAENAIRKRIEESHHPDGNVESEALMSALGVLRDLRQVTTSETRCRRMTRNNLER